MGICDMLISQDINMFDNRKKGLVWVYMYICKGRQVKK